jgi:uncharacterized protein (UPF0297 family)
MFAYLLSGTPYALQSPQDFRNTIRRRETDPVA